MAESVGKIECQKKGCHEVAELCKTKRGKFYIKCPVHGTDTLGTNAAQAEIKKIIEAGDASENVGGVVVGNEPEKPEPATPAPVAASEEQKPDAKQGGLVFIVIGLLLGIGSWLWKKAN